MALEVLAVNVGEIQPMDDLWVHGKRVVSAGGKRIKVTKFPIRVTRDGLEGNQIADTFRRARLGEGSKLDNLHGGPDKALYIYFEADYEAWENKYPGLGLKYGDLSENLTVRGTNGEGMQTIRCGQRFRCGDVVIEAKSFRLPCERGDTVMRRKTGRRVQNMALDMRELMNPGIYFAVVEEGSLPKDAVFEQEGTPNPNEPTIAEMYQGFKDAFKVPFVPKADTPDEYGNPMPTEGNYPPSPS